MRSAQRRRRLEKSKVDNRKYGVLIKILIPFVIVFSVVVFLKLTTQNWDGHRKVSIVFQEESGDINVTVLDPVLGEVTSLIIPADTEVNVARNYGTLRIKNVWQLGINEKLGGKLLAETVTNDFLFPTYLWSERDLKNIWKFVVSPGETNIYFGDRFSIALFMFRVKSIDKTEINLGKNQFLKKQILTDGSSGYVISGPISGRLTVYFADNDMTESAVSGKNIKFEIVDSTGVPGIVGRLGPILEVLGGKVVSVDKTQADTNLDCEVFGQSSEAISVIVSLFNCKKVADKSNFDLVVRIGTQFAKRF